MNAGSPKGADFAPKALKSFLSILPYPYSIVFIVALCLCLLIAPLFVLGKRARTEAEGLRSRLHELSALGDEYRSLKGGIDLLEQRRSLSKVNGVPQAVDDISSSVGLRAKVRAVKAIGSREIAGGVEESAEVQLEKVTMNELINILYRIEEAPMMLAVKRLTIRKTFENPELFNATLTLSLFIGK